jgi:predicted nucleic acid-binding protein
MKLLADSSIWIDHIRHPNPDLADALRAGAILTHPFVIGEISMGSIARRDAVLAALADLPMVTRANDREVLSLVDRHRLFGTGIGLIDAHLLASAFLTPETRLWTRDRRLREVAERLGIAAEQGA